MKVPVYSQQVERKPLTGGGRSTSADPRAFGGNPFGADAFGANVGEAMGQAGRSLQGVAGVFSAIGERMQEERDSNMVLEASMQWQKEVLHFQHDPEKGLFRRTGKDAVGAYREMEGFLSESAGRRAAELENDRQRQAFQRYTMQRGMALLEGASRFEAEQHQKWRLATAQSVAEQSINSAAANYRDGGLIQASLDEGLQALEASMAGMGEESVAAAKAEFTTKLHTQVINRYLVDDPFGAERYYSLVKDQVSGAARTAIENAIQTGTRVERTQAKADELMGKFSSETAALRWIRENASGQEENDLVAAVKTRFSERRTAQAEATRVRNERIADTVEGAASAKELDATLAKMGVPEKKRRTLVNNWMRWNAQDFGVRADFAKDEEEILALGEQYGVPKATIRRAINEHRAVFEGEAEDLALASESMDEFLEQVRKGGATDAQVKAAEQVFRKVHKPVYDEAEKQATLAEEWTIRDAIDNGQITTREQLMSAAGHQSKDKINELKKYLEDNKDPAQSYVNSEVKRRYKDANLREEELPLFMNAFLTRTRKLGPDQTEEKLKIADDLMKKETAKKGMFNWIFGTTWKIPVHLVPKGYTYSPTLDAFTNGTDKWIPPEEYLYR